MLTNESHFKVNLEIFLELCVEKIEDICLIFAVG